MKRPIRLAFALLASFALVAAACGDDDDSSSGSAPDGPTITIGAQDFGESAILAEIYRQGLAEAGFDVDIQELGGFRNLELQAFESGDINFAPEYAASMLEELNEKKGEATADAEETTDKLQTYLDDLSLTALEPSEAVDTNSFVVTEETADRLGLATLSDLAEKGADLKLGAPADCPTNPFCIPGLERVYELDLNPNYQALEVGAIADALEAGSIDVGLLFSTDGRIADKGWVLLEDDKTMLAADNVVPVLHDDLIDAYGDELVDRLNEISAELNTADLTELNKRLDVDKEDADKIATDWLTEHDLI